MSPDEVSKFAGRHRNQDVTECHFDVPPLFGFFCVTIKRGPSGAIRADPPKSSPRKETKMADQVLDAKGLNCPLPILKAKKAISQRTQGRHA